MPLQTTGPISLKQIADEFEDAAPHSLSEFYGLTNTLPASGIIDFDDFYGQSNGFVLAKTITSNILQYNLNTDLIANGWNSIDPVEATITINSGIYVYSNNTSIAGFTIGTLPAGSIITIINNGYIIGKGGNGATARSSRVAATTGGPAMNINHPVSITNNSYIAGGGGGGGDTYNGTLGTGGGGGAGGGAGGGGGDTPGYSYATGGAGGSIGATGSNGQPVPDETWQAGGASGGGGGRILPGTGASGQTCTVPWNAPGEARAGGLGGGAGGSGGAVCGGIQAMPKQSTGGAGGSANNSGGIGGGPNGAAGGGGGGWGASGGAGSTAFSWSTSSGASGGKCVNLNGNTVTWVATGTRYGAIS